MLLSALLLLGGVRPAHAAAGVDFVADIVSDYIFRGASQRQGTSLQPSLSYTIVDTVTASLWANVRMEGSVAISQTDYSLQWTWLNASPAQVTVGGVYYDRNSRLLARPTQEVFLGLDFDAPLKPSLYAWYDFGTNPGAYYELGAKHRFLLPDYRGTIELAGRLGFDSGRVNGFNDALLSVAFTRSVGDWRISPRLDFHFPAAAVDRGAHGFRPAFVLSASRSF
ncbi:MAG: hypothetical protein HYU66_01175 [Armatimonadetes bacterium]|nr:hypothetical protein [Armatimonadota bacterium]